MHLFGSSTSDALLAGGRRALLQARKPRVDR